jgi:coenzyme F420-reducing hydrogenase alpha subunit
MAETFRSVQLSHQEEVMKRNLNINIEHMARVEGHGNIVLNVKEGRIETLQWQIPEAPRFFEAMLRGRPFDQLQPLASRICGICSIAHSLAALKAVEAALGVEISDQTRLLRRLALHGENIQSHILHIGYLAAPDLFGTGSIIPMLKTARTTVTRIVKIHRMANHLSDVICGRTTHPLRFRVGGFTMLPTPEALADLHKELKRCAAAVHQVAEDLHRKIERLPDFSRETEYIALQNDQEYALYDGEIASTDTGRHPVETYRSITNEYVVPHSTAKYTRHQRASYMVGALARFNLNASSLKPPAREIAALFGLTPLNCNPFMNTIAQLVEVADSIEDALEIMDILSARGLTEEDVTVKTRAGRGVGAVEAPRGILFHEFALDELGNCTKANFIIPTNQNNASIQQDMEALVPKIMDLPQQEIELMLEMLVRAYDPCISCASHFLKVRFK